MVLIPVVARASKATRTAGDPAGSTPGWIGKTKF
jgi:hypothetical protein